VRQHLCSQLCIISLHVQHLRVCCVVCMNLKYDSMCTSDGSQSGWSEQEPLGLGLSFDGQSVGPRCQQQGAKDGKRRSKQGRNSA
jgi:hypothetical protein